MPYDIKTFKKFFFDKRAVTSAAERAENALLSKVGAYVRRGAKSSIKYREGAAVPGVPPHAHRSGAFTRQKVSRKTGAVTRQASSPLRELIFFGRDPAAASVVVGPVLFGKKSGAPERLEYGGVGTVGRKRPRRAVYEARPYMRPALARELPKVPQWVKDTVR